MLLQWTTYRLIVHFYCLCINKLSRFFAKTNRFENFLFALVQLLVSNFYELLIYCLYVIYCLFQPACYIMIYCHKTVKKKRKS